MHAAPAHPGHHDPSTRMDDVERAPETPTPPAGTFGCPVAGWGDLSVGPASLKRSSGEAESAAEDETRRGPDDAVGLEGAAERARRQRVAGLVFLTVFIDFLGLGVLLPVVPALVERFADSALSVGVLSAAFALSQFLATPALGAISDRLGRRPVLMCSLIGSALGYAVLGWAGALWMMVLARVIDGVTGANVSTAQAALADITPARLRSRAFALIGVAVGLGFVVGPALGGVLSQRFGITTPVFFAGGLALVAGVFAWIALPETLPSSQRRRGALRASEWNPLANIGSAWRTPGVRAALMALIFAGVPFAGLGSNFGVYLDRVFSMGPAQAGSLFTCMGVVMMLVQGVVVRRLSGKVDDRLIAAAGLVVFGAGLLVIALAPAAGSLSPWGLYVGISLFAAGHGLLSPTLTGIVSRAVDERAQGSVLGVATGLLSLTRVVGPLIAALMFDYISPASAYWSGVVWVALAVWMVGLMKRGGVEMANRRSQIANLD